MWYQLEQTIEYPMGCSLTWVIGTPQRCVNATKNVYRRCNNSKNETASMQQSTADWPTRFKEWAAQGIYYSCFSRFAACQCIYQTYCCHYHMSDHGNFRSWHPDVTSIEAECQQDCPAWLDVTSIEAECQQDSARRDWRYWWMSQNAPQVGDPSYGHSEDRWLGGLCG